MNRLRAAVATVGVFAAWARGDDVDWKSAPAPPPAVVVAAPVPAPQQPPPPPPPPEVTQWVPAPVPPPPPAPKPFSPPQSPFTEAPVFRPATPVPPPPPSAAPTQIVPAATAPPPPAYRPIEPPPQVPVVAPLPPPLPVQLPDLPPAPREFPVVAVPEVPPPPKPVSDPKSEPLPKPRPVDPKPAEPKAFDPAVPSWTVVNPACNVPPDTRPGLEPAPGSAPSLGGVPVRGRTFGSPALRLSRDFALRDLFGFDLARSEGPGPVSVLPEPDGGPPEDQFFISAEYLLWWVNPARIPVLATTSGGGGNGFLGQPGTTALLGPGAFGPSFRDGFRVRAGGWMDDCAGRGYDASFFFLGRRGETRVFDGLPTLTRPFFSPNFNSEFGEIVALPNLSTGRFEVSTSSFLWGADVNHRHAVCRTCDRTTGWFAGYRHLNLSEDLAMTEFITATGPLATDPVGTKIVVGDRFNTRNQFHGGHVGWLVNRRYGRWDLDLRASVALGVTLQRLEIDGFQQRTRPGQTTENFRGGLLATGPNLGKFDATKFGVVPEATASLGYAVTPNLRLSLGYNFIYWSSVIRPGDQIDRVIDVTLVPNPPAGVASSGQNRPIPLFRQSDFWAQGLTLGATWRW